jgi:hypothetical protein
VLCGHDRLYILRFNRLMQQSLCLDQSKRDPQLEERVALLKAASSYQRGDLVLKNGWATMPGTTEGNRLVAAACAEKVGI